MTHGEERFAPDQRTLRRMAATAARMLEERRLAEEAEESRRLAAVDKTRSALLAAVGHDLRTPLAGIKVAVSTLRQGDVDWTDQEREELLATIEESADRLARLVSNLLDATRIQAGAVVVDLQPVALDEVVFAAMSSVLDEEVSVDVPLSLPLVVVDPVLLERVVVNLVDNALRFRPPDTKVEIVGQTTPAAVELCIVDHGPGISVDARGRIFEPFQRLDDHSQGGTGLGLAIVKGFCDAMGISVETLPTPTGGLTIRLMLPVVR